MYVKREDLADCHIGGNKWRKLKYNLALARAQNKNTLLTFGGAWSNHIYATAAAGKRFGFETIGIIRGEEPRPLNPTLKFARNCGMQLVFVDRKTYRNKTSVSFLESLRDRYCDFYLLPEGGSNQLALRGCAEIVMEIAGQFDILTVACGTGATLAGVTTRLGAGQRAIGFAALKDASFLNRDVKYMLADSGHADRGNWHIELGYHFGGYAKTSPGLFTFIRAFKAEFGIELDAVYTGKMLYGLFDLIRKRSFNKGTRIIALHTGGIQGNAGFPTLTFD